MPQVTAALTSITASRRFLWAKRLLLWCVAAGAIGLLVKAVPLADRCDDPVHKIGCTPGLRTTLAHANLEWVVALGALALVPPLVWAWRWRVLIRLANVEVSLGYSWRVTLEAMAGSLVLPGGMGGDALRVSSMVGRGAPALTVVASVFLDRASGLAALSLLASILSFGFGSTDGRWLGFAMATIPAAYASTLAFLRHPQVRDAPALESGWSARFVAPVVRYLSNPGALQAIGQNLVGCCLTSAIQLLVARGLVSALGVTPTDESWVYVGFTLALVVSAVPSTPGGVGAVEAAYVLFLSRAGVPPATGLAVSLLMRTYSGVSALAGAILLLLRDAGSGSGSRPSGSRSTGSAGGGAAPPSHQVA